MVLLAWLVLGACVASDDFAIKTNVARHLAAEPPPMRGRTFSIVLPVFPPQMREFIASMAMLRRFLIVDDLDKIVLISPCTTGEGTLSAATCTEPTRIERERIDWKSPSPEWGSNQSLYDELEANGGRIDQLGTWEEGACALEVLDFVPRSKVMHFCDDSVICGEQLVKLGVARFITSPHMLILDADAYAINQISAASLLTAGGTSRMLSVRRVRSGERFGTRAVGGRWYERYPRALEVLRENVNQTVRANTTILGVTPQVLSTAVVRQILDTVEERQQQAWWQVLGFSKFTEFSLYNTWMLLNWDTVGKTLHDNTLGSKQIAIWSHDLDHVPPDAKLRYAERTLGAQIRTYRYAPTFMVCQDESGFTPDMCQAVATSCADLIASHCKKKPRRAVLENPAGVLNRGASATTWCGPHYDSLEDADAPSPR